VGKGVASADPDAGREQPTLVVLKLFGERSEAALEELQLPPVPKV